MAATRAVFMRDQAKGRVRSIMSERPRAWPGAGEQTIVLLLAVLALASVLAAAQA